MDEHDGLRFLYFDTAHALDVHDWIIEKSGGLPGTKNLHYIEGPLAHIQNDDYYRGVVQKMTHLVYSINKDHGFHDGNKRSSIALGAYFLELNGYDYAVTRFVHEMENVAVCVAGNHIGKNLLETIISSIIYEDEFTETLKLDIIAAYTRCLQEQN